VRLVAGVDERGSEHLCQQANVRGRIPRRERDVVHPDDLDRELFHGQLSVMVE
jgi:hypothetical protein